MHELIQFLWTNVVFGIYIEHKINKYLLRFLTPKRLEYYTDKKTIVLFNVPFFYFLQGLRFKKGLYLIMQNYYNSYVY